MMKFWYFPILLLVAVLLCSYCFFYTPAIIGWVYLAASIISFYLYATDKKAAKLGGWRVSENTLQVSALLGGWPGALLAQQKLRHKTKKVSFRTVFVLTILLNSILLTYFHTDDGSRNLHSAIDLLENQAKSHFGSNSDVDLFLRLLGYRLGR